MGVLNKILNFFVRDAAERRRFLMEFNANANRSFQSLFSDTLYEALSGEGNSDPSYRHEFSAPVFVSGFEVQAKAGREITVEEILTIGKIILSDQSIVRRMYVLHWDTLTVTEARTGRSVNWRIKDFLNFGGLLGFNGGQYGIV